MLGKKLKRSRKIRKKRDKRLKRKDKKMLKKELRNLNGVKDKQVGKNVTLKAWKLWSMMLGRKLKERKETLIVKTEKLVLINLKAYNK